MRSSTNHTSEASLLVSPAATKNGELVFLYELSNSTTEAIFPQVFMRDHFAEFHPQGTLTSDLMQCEMIAESTLRFYAGGVPLLLPPGISGVVPRVPLCPRIEPGGRFQAPVRAKLPLIEWHAYQPPRAGKKHRKVNVARIEVVVGYTRESEVSELRPDREYPALFQAIGPVARSKAMLDVSTLGVKLELYNDPKAYRFTDYD